METLHATAERLLTALEQLAGREGVLLRSHDLIEAVDLGAQAEPLVKKLCTLAEDPAVGPLRERIDALVARRRRHAAALEEQIARLQGELRRLNEASQRLTRMAPIYSPPPSAPARSRLNTAA
jgi:hypothetical protein